MYIAVDGMGGDFGPLEMVSGVALALRRDKDIQVIITGDADQLNHALSSYPDIADRVRVVPTTDVVTMHDAPSTVLRQKPNSSLARAFDLVAEKSADAVVSAGNTGAILAGGIFKLKRIHGVLRPALAPFIPSAAGKREKLIVDVGANADCKPEYLAQFALMASLYVASVYHRENPKVGLINIGEEAEKGNELTKQAYALLQKLPIQFIGNVEAREILRSDADILVTDGFTGNIVLKFLEGTASTLFSELKTAMMGTFLSKMGAMLAKSQLKKMKQQFDYDSYGAAILLGVDGGVFKAHGSATAQPIGNAVIQAAEFIRGDVISTIRQNLKDME